MPNLIEAALPELSELAEQKLESVQDVKALLTHARKKGRVDEAVAEMRNDLTKNFDELRSTVAEMKEQVLAIDEQTKLQNAEASNLKALFENASDEDKKAIWEQASKTFGGAAAELALFGNSMEKMLYGKIARGTETYESAKNLREINDLALTMTAINKGNPEYQGDEHFSIHKGVYEQQLQRLAKAGYDVETFKKGVALDSATANEGQDFIPTDLSMSIIENIWLPLRVAPMFQRLTMTTPTFNVPQITTRGRAFLMAQALVDTDFYSNLATATEFQSSKMSFTAQKLAAQMFWSDEIVEDAQVPFAQIIMEKIAEAMGVSIEDMVINGNRTNYGTALDNAGVSKRWTSTADARYLADGLRVSVGNAQKVNSNGTMNLALLRSVRRTLGKFGVDPNVLAWVFNPVTMADVLGIDEVLRWRDIQDRATVMTGILAEIDGIGITFSEYIPNDLNASGLYDNITLTKTIGLLFRKDSHLFGDRRLVRVERDRSITSQQNVVVATWRGDFQKKRQGMSTTEAAWAYNLPG